MANDKLELEGVVTKVLKGGKFEVGLTEKDNYTVLCTLGGKLIKNNIRIVLGDKVTVGISPYDLTKGIIIWRGR